MRWIFAGALAALAAQAAAQESGYLQLVDRLDRPADGYCLDVLGWSASTFRTDLPVNAHNCKAGRAPDGLVTLTAGGQIRFDALGLCLTAHGVAGQSLPGAPLLLAGCGVDGPAQRVRGLQTFQHSDGHVRLSGSDLCLAVGSTSAATFSASDRWRVLRLESCAAAPVHLTTWQVIPGVP